MSQHDEIDGVKNKVFNVTILVGIILGVATFLVSLQNYFESSSVVNYYLNLLIIIIVLGVYIFRRKIPHAIKSDIVIIGIFILAFADIYKLGAYSPAKILLVLIPFFALISYNNKKIIGISISVIVLFMGFAYLFISERIMLTVDLNARNETINTWIVNIMLIGIVAFGITTIVHHYSVAFYRLITRLEDQNAELKIHRENLESLVAERSRELEIANEELSTINEELYQSKNIIENQNIELKSTLDHLQLTQASLVQSEKMAALGILSTGVAHEINNPLNFIMGGYIGLSQYFEKAEKEKNVEFFLSTIKAGVDRASGIVTALNQFSQTSGAVDENCPIQVIIDNCLVILGNQYEALVEVETNFPPDPIPIKGNCGRLHQALFNILTNAFHSISNEGKVSCSVKTEGRYCVCEISDTGYGISPEDLEHVTEPFFTRKEPGKGVGFGLPIAYAIIQEHKGTLEIESEVAKGTTVRVKLPINL